jgi:hypothetical protein
MRAVLIIATALLSSLPYMLSAQPSAYAVVSAGSLQPGQPIPPPQDRVVLTVRGRIGMTNNGEAVLFDLPTLEQIGLVRFTTPTAWTAGPATFEGVLMSRFLEMLAIPPDATEATMTALNDFQVTIPLTDFRKWPVIMALKRDGRYMTVRDKGPLWIVYPRHAFPELTTPRQYDNWIWQLKEVVVR